MRVSELRKGVSLLLHRRISTAKALPAGADMSTRRRWSSFQLRASSRDKGDDSSQDSAPRQQQHTHLVVLVNGVNGHPSNWAQLVERTGCVAGMSHMCFRPSAANAKKATFAGIDVCGDRLVSELRGIVGSQQHSFTEISFIGHSMGGLVARYAIGKLFDAHSSSILGLRPRHFITLATPHLGCDVDGVAQVPMLGWAGDLPLIGPNLRRAMFGAAAPVTASLLGRSGEQLFLRDPAPPLLLRMCSDSEGEAAFMSALAAFATHTVYANVAGDQVVGWANSSLRFADELPEPPAKGVRLCHPATPPPSPSVSYLHLSNASDGAVDRLSTQLTSFPLDDVGDDEGDDDSDVTRSTSTGIGTTNDGNYHSDCTGTSISSGSGDGAGSSSSSVPLLGGLLRRIQTARRIHRVASGEPAGMGSTKRVRSHVNGDVTTMLLRLQAIPWRRVDVCYHEKKTHFMAHNHIQVTRKWLNRSGLPTLSHLVQLLEGMEGEEETEAREIGGK